VPSAPPRSVQTSTRCGRSPSRRGPGRARATQLRDGAEAPEQFKEGRSPRSACLEAMPDTVQPHSVRNEPIGHREQFGRRLPKSQARVPMRYMVGAEQFQQVPSLAHRPDGVFRVARTARSAQPTLSVRRPASPYVVAALIDIKRRPASQIRGPKWGPCRNGRERASAVPSGNRRFRGTAGCRLFSSGSRDDAMGDSDCGPEGRDGPVWEAADGQQPADVVTKVVALEAGR
jgi:hypothetical protein